MDTIIIGAIGCFGVGFGSYALKNCRFPHISECGCIGSCYLMLGIHDHECFDVIIEVIEVSNVQYKKKYVVEIESGRFHYKTSHNQENEGKVGFYEKINAHIRQCDNHITIKLFSKGVLKNTLVGTLEIGVDELLRDQLPRRRVYTMDMNDISTSKIMLSFYKVGEVPDDISPLMMQVLMESPQIDIKDVEFMSPIDQLRLFAKVITGPLKKMNLFGPKWTEYYFVPIEITQTKWELRYWKCRDDYLSGKKYIGAYALLGVSTILPDDSNKLHFYVKYHDKSGVYDLIFKRVDRDRDIWTQGLFEFITRQRELLASEACKTITKCVNKPIKNSIKILRLNNEDKNVLEQVIADMGKEMISP